MHRLLPGGWVTLQDIYRSTVDAELFGRKIGEARELADRLCPVRAVIATKDLTAHKESLEDWTWEPVPGSDKAACQLDPALRDRLKELKVAYATEESGGGAGSEFREQVEAIERWYLHDWMALDAKLRTSIVEGISVFLSLFDQPQVAGVFCPPPPDPDESIHIYSTAPDEDAEAVRPVPGLRRRLPPLSELIEGGKVLALNMPAGANPALARAIGVLLKNAWMQALLRRPAEAARRPGRYLRPAVFICDEYQSAILLIITLCDITLYDVVCSPTITPAITLCAAGGGIPWTSPVRRSVVRPSRGTRPHPISSPGGSSSATAWNASNDSHSTTALGDEARFSIGWPAWRVSKEASRQLEARRITHPCKLS